MPRRVEFGASTFCASCYANEQCGANGLPLTPNSIRILGRFQKLISVEHPKLCAYIDLVRTKHGTLLFSLFRFFVYNFGKFEDFCPPLWIVVSRITSADIVYSSHDVIVLLKSHL